jgi:hypothetical protein
MMKRKTLVVSFVLVLVLAATAVVAQAGGNSPAHLGEKGWNCFDPDGPGNPLGVHCMPPGAAASSASMSVKVYDTEDVAATDAEFEGTEILIRADLYHGQPCPQDGLEEYEGLDLNMDGNVDYFACHHYDTDHH